MSQSEFANLLRQKGKKDQTQKMGKTEYKRRDSQNKAADKK